MAYIAHQLENSNENLLSFAIKIKERINAAHTSTFHLDESPNQKIRKD